MIIRLGISLFFALWLQVVFRFCLDVDVSGFLAALPVYIVYLAIGHTIVLRVYQPNYRLLLLLGGVFGCLIELCTQGYSVMRYDSFTPFASFAYHAVYPVVGVILTDKIPHTALMQRVRAVLFFATLSVPLGYFIADSHYQEQWFIWSSIAPYFVIFILAVLSKPLIKRVHA